MCIPIFLKLNMNTEVAKYLKGYLLVQIKEGKVIPIALVSEII